MARVQKRCLDFDNLIFLSHKVSTEGPIVTELDQRLKANGLNSWYCSRDIQPGDIWAYEISVAASQCRFVVIFVTEAWLASGECQAEWNVCRRRNLQGKVPIVIPVLRDFVSVDSHPTGMFITSNFNGLEMDQQGRWMDKLIQRIVGVIHEDDKLCPVIQKSARKKEVIPTTIPL